MKSNFLSVYFCAAVCESGISDYGLWFEQDAVGEFRDEMEGQGWIGGSPATRAKAYASRGGLTTAGNLCTPLAITHGELDPRCPVEQARRYADAVRRLGKSSLITYYEMKDVGATGGHWGGITPEQAHTREQLIARHLASHRTPVTLSDRGTLTVAGYLKTKRFEVILESIDQIATLDYDLPAGRFALRGPTAREAKLRVRRCPLEGQAPAWPFETVEHRTVAPERDPPDSTSSPAGWRESTILVTWSPQ